MSVKPIVEFWRKKLNKTGLSPDIVQKYVHYIIPILKNLIPIIFDFQHLCLLLGRNRKYLASVINSSINHYREFEIAKKKGGKRLISVPYPALMECQQWISLHILSKVKIHYSAHGFAVNKSIITHSKIHIGQTHLLKIDLKDFFTSIKINQVITVFNSLGYNHWVSFYLASICCLNGVLPQGAPTSPILSNIVAKSLDRRLMEFAKRFKLHYSRYADDLAFSGDMIPVKFIEYITLIIESCGFKVNEEKTRLIKHKGKRILTGISICEDSIKVPREYKRNLRMEIHCIRKLGLHIHLRKKKIKNQDYLQSIIGKINFWLSVEPDNSFAKKALAELKILNLQ